MDDVETNRGVDVPEAETCDHPECKQAAGNEECRVQVDDLLRNVQLFVRPREDVILAEEDEHEKDERDGKKRDVPLEEPDH